MMVKRALTILVPFGAVLIIGISISALSQQQSYNEINLKRIAVGNFFEINRDLLDSDELALRIADVLADRSESCLWIALDSPTNTALEAVLVKLDLNWRLVKKIKLTNAPVYGITQTSEGSVAVFQPGKITIYSSSNLVSEKFIETDIVGSFGWAGLDPVIALKGRVVLPYQPERLIIDDTLGGVLTRLRVIGHANGHFTILDTFEGIVFLGDTSSGILSKTKIESSYIEKARDNYKPKIDPSDGYKPRRALLFPDIASAQERFFVIVTGLDYRSGALILSFDQRGKVGNTYRCSVSAAGSDGRSDKFAVGPEFISANKDMLVLADSGGGFSACQL